VIYTIDVGRTSTRRAAWSAVLVNLQSSNHIADVLHLTFPDDPLLTGKPAELIAQERQCRLPADFTLRFAECSVVPQVRRPERAWRLMSELLEVTGEWEESQ
jgi:hypothetical protein